MKRFLRGMIPLITITAVSLPCRLGAGKVISNRVDGDGFPLVVPAVRKIVKGSGVFALPDRAAVSVPAGGEKLVDILNSRSGARRSFHKAAASEKAAVRFVLDKGKDVPVSPEGYVLSISSLGVELKARDPRGLFYGAHTLARLVGNSGGPELPVCRIQDWPDLPVRGIFLNLREMTSAELAEFLRVIPALASLKYNTLVLEFAENLPLRNTPFTARKTPTLTQDDIDRLIAVARENHMEIIPHLQTVTHTRWLQSHPEYDEKISCYRKKYTDWNHNWNCSICPEKPLARELTDYTIRETIRLFKPRALHLGLDEFTCCHWRQCEYCPRPHTTGQLIREVCHVVEFTRKLGVTPWIYHDSFVPGFPERGEQVLPKLPKDTVINVWSYGENPRVNAFRYFLNNGFRDQVGVSFCNELVNTMNMPRVAKRMGARGVVFTYWHFMRGELRDLARISPHAAAGTALAANYAWNTASAPFTALSYDPAYETRLGLTRETAPGRGRCAPVPLYGVFNTLLGGDPRFPMLKAYAVRQMASELAAKSPEGFRLAVSPSGELAAAALSGGPNDPYPAGSLTVPLGDVAAPGFSMLMTASIPDDLNAFGYRNPVNMPELFKVTFRYADGSSATRNFAYRRHYNNWNSETSGIEARFACRGNDSRGALYSFYALDIENPHPDRPVKALEIANARRFGVAVAMLALSVREPSAGWKAPAGNPTLPAERLKGREVNAAPRQVIADFNRAVPGWRHSTEGKLSGKAVARVVSDRTSPVPGKVLEIVMPPPENFMDNGRHGVRSCLDIPVRGAGRIGAVHCLYSISNPEAVTHSAVYLTDAKMANLEQYFDFTCPEDKSWRRLTIPRGAMEHEGREVPLSDDKIATLRFSIWLNSYDKPVRIRLRLIETSAEDDRADGPFCVRRAE